MGELRRDRDCSSSERPSEERSATELGAVDDEPPSWNGRRTNEAGGLHSARGQIFLTHPNLRVALSAQEAPEPPRRANSTRDRVQVKSAIILPVARPGRRRVEP